MASAPRFPLGPEDLWAASLGFWRVWVVHLGRRYGLLEALGRSRAGLSPGALARAAGTAEGPTALWCAAAAGLGLLRPSGGRFEVPPSLAPALVEGESVDFLGGHMSYIALRSLDFAGFDELFREGRPSAREQRHLAEAFAQATPWDHTAFLSVVPRAVPAVGRALRSGAEVLDVGCGTGSWCLRVASAFPAVHIRGVDRDATALRRARARAAAAGLEGRVSFDAGSAESRAYAERFDLVHLGEVLCGATDDLALLLACRRALKPGGRLVVGEGLHDPRAGPGDPGNVLVAAMGLEFALQPARFYTRGGLAKRLQEAGLGGVRILPAGGGFFFAVASPTRTSRTPRSGPPPQAPRSPRRR